MMKENIINDSVAEDAALRDESEELLAPVSDDAAINAALEDMDLANRFLERGTEIHSIRVPRRGNYAFAGNIFIPEDLASNLCEGDIVAVHFHFGRRGPKADRVAAASKYFGWHPEVLERIRGVVEKRNAELAEFIGRR